jgi:hypothetical protein
MVPCQAAHRWTGGFAMTDTKRPSMQKGETGASKLKTCRLY